MNNSITFKKHIELKTAINKLTAELKELEQTKIIPNLAVNSTVKVGDYQIDFKEIKSMRFDTTSFKQKKESEYKKWLKESSYKKLTIKEI